MRPGSFTDWTETFNAGLEGSISNISSFGEDAQGNLYIVSLGGEVFRLEQIVPGVPEPLTIVGSLTALGFGVLFKKKLSEQNQSK